MTSKIFGLQNLLLILTEQHDEGVPVYDAVAQWGNLFKRGPEVLHLVFTPHFFLPELSRKHK